MVNDECLLKKQRMTTGYHLSFYLMSSVLFPSINQMPGGVPQCQIFSSEYEFVFLPLGLGFLFQKMEMLL